MTSFPTVAEWYGQPGRSQAQRLFFEGRLSPEIMRDSGFDWAVTIESETPVRMKLDPLQIDANALCYKHFDGFKCGGLPLHGPHARNPTRFSFHCFGNECLMDIIGGLIAA